MKQLFKYNKAFALELGAVLEELEIAYYTYGSLNEHKDNVVWVCHALTASGDVVDWWSGLVGAGRLIDTDRYFVVCANILGSCYGTTGPTSINPLTKQLYGRGFPAFTIRDMVNAHQVLQEHLGIRQIRLLMGGSMGGYQATEWALMQPGLIQNLFLIATAAEESAWGKAIHATQRMAIRACPGWDKGVTGEGDDGLKAARGIGMLSYRNYELFKAQQSDTDLNRTGNHKAASYIAYQAEKLAARFDALSYYKLTEAMDTHQIARNRMDASGKILEVLSIPCLVMGISSDILCPVAEQEFLAEHLPCAQLHIIDSAYGHDGFLIESEKIGVHLKAWMGEYGI